MRGEGAGLSPSLLGLGLICNKVETQCIMQSPWWCVCQGPPRLPSGVHWGHNAAPVGGGVVILLG